VKFGRTGFTLIAAAAAACLFLAAAHAGPGPAGGSRLQGIALTGDPAAMHRVLISFETPPGEGEHARVRELGGRIRHAYRLVPTLSAHLPEAAVHALARRPGVVRIEADGRVRVADELAEAWGVQHIQAGVAHARNVTGTGDRQRHRLHPS
jgi:hypothetical protein